MAAKLEFILQREGDALATECADLKAGTKVNLREAEGGSLQVVTEAGAVLGCVPPEHAANISRGAFAGHVRTIKRDPESKSITEIAVRFVRGEKTIQPEVHLPPNIDEDEEDVRKLSREQLELLANNEDIRRFLRDERLQGVILDIDSAPNREAALKSMLKAPNFKEFTDKVLEVVAPPE